MKQFLKNAFAILRKTKNDKPAGRSEPTVPPPGLGVRSQVKAGLRITLENRLIS